MNKRNKSYKNKKQKTNVDPNRDARYTATKLTRNILTARQTDRHTYRQTGNRTTCQTAHRKIGQRQVDAV